MAEPTILGNSLEDRLKRVSSPSTTTSTKTATGTRETYTPGVSFTSNDPLQGTLLEEGAIFGLDPLGVFDVPQLQVDLERLDPAYLTQLVADQARKNAFASIGLEKEVDPFTAASRDKAMQSLYGILDAGGTDNAAMQQFFSDMMASKLVMPELKQSDLLTAAREKALADLNLGYELPQDVRNLVARTAAGRTSGAGTMGSLGRDVTARDLGLTSLDIFDKRMGRASALGAAEEQTNIGQQGLKASIDNMNRNFQFGAGQAKAGYDQQMFQNTLGMNQFLQGIDRPVAGLDPGALASFIVADLNQRNQIVNDANVAQLNAATESKSSQNALMGDVFQGLMGMFCWVAREVYGPGIEWQQFRLWMINESDDKFFNWYIRYGERFAAWLHRNPVFKPSIRKWMDSKIEFIRGKEFGDWRESLLNRLGE